MPDVPLAVSAILAVLAAPLPLEPKPNTLSVLVKSVVTDSLVASALAASLNDFNSS